ncbi:MAG: peptidylprolyl isomerase [Bacteroidales bacterium]|nr:peptidylprolyl isomerase [Bacteroidales bacterium]
MKQILSVSAICAVALASIAGPKKNVIDEVAWVIGDEAIFRSDVEDMYSSMRSEGVSLPGDPYCTLPERMAVEKLYLHQAKIDTIEAPESQVSSAVERRIDFFVQNLGSREKVEEYFRKSMPALKEQLTEVMRNNYIVDQVQTSLTKNVKATPNEVRKYFDALPEDSIPYIPLQVETQIVRINPVIPRQEIEDIKARLRDYADRVNKGESEFSTLAIMYSDDGSSVQGGELGFHGKADFVPEFSAVAFNLSDPKKVSRIVETEYGYHIIQLIEKRGDQANFRHILLRPKVSSTELKNSVSRLDSIRKEIVAGAITFDEAARFISQDKDSRNNRGIMMNNQTGSSRFEMQELPVEIARQVEKMEPGDVSEAFIMMDPKRNTEVAAIVRLTSRIPGHRANLSDDYNMIKEMYLAHLKQEILKDWVEKKIKETYVHIEDGWDKCDFEYEGWIK